MKELWKEENLRIIEKEYREVRQKLKMVNSKKTYSVKKAKIIWQKLEIIKKKHRDKECKEGREGSK